MHPPSLMGGGILLETKSNIVHPVFNKYDYTMLCHSASVRQHIAMRNEYAFTLLPTLEDLNCNTVQPGVRSIIVCSLLENSAPIVYTMLILRITEYNPFFRLHAVTSFFPRIVVYATNIVCAMLYSCFWCVLCYIFCS